MPSQKNVSQALQDLQRSARRHLSPQAARHLYEEVAAHFEAAVQARMEMGESQEEAERRAVEEFGDLQRIVQRVGDAQTAPGAAVHPVFTVALFVGAASYAGAYVTPMGFGAYATLAGILGGLAVAMGATWRVRRFQWRSFLYVLVPVWLTMSAGMALVYRTPQVTDGSYLRPSELRESIAFRQTSIHVQERYLANLEAAHARFLREGGLAIPRQMHPQTGEITFAQARNAEQARRAWDQTAGDFAEIRASIAREAIWIAAANEALNRPWLAEIPYQALHGLEATGAILAIFAAGQLIALFARRLADGLGHWQRQRRNA